MMKVCVDTRKLRPGDLFFALEGAQVDGHDYLDEAAKKGAAAAVVSRDVQANIPLIKVNDPLQHLQDLAKQTLNERNVQIVAVTGSVGKTTTKEFIRTLLSLKFRVASSPWNYNSQIGLPLAILNHTEGSEEVLVLEMAMTEAGQIAKLVEIAPPDVALITMTTLAHAENFEDLESIGRAKGEIFLHPKTRLGILNREIVNYDELCQIGTCEKFPFSEEFLEIEIPVPGSHNRQNFLAAATVAKQMGLTFDEIVEGAKKLTLPQRRFEVIRKNGITFVNDSYNACETSIKAALRDLPEPQRGGKRIAFLGQIPELGQFSEQCHRAVGSFSLDYVDLMICFGEPCRPIYEIWKEAGKEVYYGNTREEMTKKLHQQAHQGDVVLLKGANKTQTWKVLDD